MAARSMLISDIICINTYYLYNHLLLLGLLICGNHFFKDEVKLKD
jgi:hypothetical protein